MNRLQGSDYSDTPIPGHAGRWRGNARNDGAQTLVRRDELTFEVRREVVTIRNPITGSILAVRRFDSPADALDFAHPG